MPWSSRRLLWSSFFEASVPSSLQATRGSTMYGLVRSIHIYIYIYLQISIGHWAGYHTYVKIWYMCITITANCEGIPIFVILQASILEAKLCSALGWRACCKVLVRGRSLPASCILLTADVDAGYRRCSATTQQKEDCIITPYYCFQS